MQDFPLSVVLFMCFPTVVAVAIIICAICNAICKDRSAATNGGGDGDGNAGEIHQRTWALDLKNKIKTIPVINLIPRNTQIPLT